MKLTLLGTGGPLPDGKRAGPSALVTHNHQHILVGCGEQSVRGLFHADIPPEQVQTLLFTSLDFEYTSDVGRFVLASWIRGRREPLTVLGPPGTETLCARLLELHAEDIHARLSADGLDPNGIRLDAHEIDCNALNDDARQPVTALAMPGLTVRATRTSADVGQPAYAYRFETETGSLVLAGPSRISEALRTLAQGSDLLVHEAHDPPALDSFLAAQPHYVQWANGIRRNSATVAEVAGLAAAAKCGTLVLTGTSPPDFTADELLDNVRNLFTGRVVLAEDQFTWDSAGA